MREGYGIEERKGTRSGEREEPKRETGVRVTREDAQICTDAQERAQTNLVTREDTREGVKQFTSLAGARTLPSRERTGVDFQRATKRRMEITQRLLESARTDSDCVSNQNPKAQHRSPSDLPRTREYEREVRLPSTPRLKYETDEPSAVARHNRAWLDLVCAWAQRRRVKPRRDRVQEQTDRRSALGGNKAVPANQSAFGSGIKSSTTEQIVGPLCPTRDSMRAVD
ncbi:hypothetical protein B0H12DRAFT_1081462 [Mycena haematopus]|nr:hypothetical protein B0H12DRAFT_1081462 [Mycena haematopus]